MVVADSLSECSSYDSAALGKTISYCVQRSHPEYKLENEPVVYFMHGLGGNEITWSQAGYSEALRILVESDKDFPAITFISFETELDSFFSDFKGSNEGNKAYETWFIDEFIPTMEQRLPICRERKCRGLAGVSMGGFGSLKTAFKHPDLFQFAAANSPALPPFSIHADNSLWREYFSDTKIGPAKGMLLLKDVRNIFPTEELYLSNDPITLAETFEDPILFPSLYFDVGSEDNFGFQVGFEILKNVLDEKKVNYSSFLEPGGDHFIYKHRNRNLLEFIANELKELKVSVSR
jgi:S-formylglutathione hydrolase FrmB